MLDRVTGGEMQLRIATNEIGDKGQVIETFKIMVRVGNQPERDVETFSGGEKRILGTILRLSICEWSGRIHGWQSEHVRIDEAFDAISHDERQEEMVRLYVSLADRYQKVITITHDAELADQLPSRIRFKRTACGSAIEEAA